MKTTVVNVRTETCDVYIGRPSKWGNPFLIGQDGGCELDLHWTEAIKK